MHVPAQFVSNKIYRNNHTVEDLAHSKIVKGSHFSVSLPNGISFRPTALARCMSETDDIQTDRPR